MTSVVKFGGSSFLLFALSGHNTVRLDQGGKVLLDPDAEVTAEAPRSNRSPANPPRVSTLDQKVGRTFIK